MHLIPNWRRAWRYFTVQIGLLAIIWVNLPESTQVAVLRVLHLDREVLPGIMGVAVIVARVIAQSKVREPLVGKGAGPL